MKKKALLIGINEYKHYAEYPLDGCINDVEIVTSVLKGKFGFTEDEITFLRDKEATRSRIVKEMRNILKHCEKDALIVLHFSGHGTRRVSKDNTRPDGLEETIIPYDSGPDDALNLDIRDSDLRDWIALLSQKTQNICIFSDSCFSGSIVRGEKVRGITLDSSMTSSSSSKKIKQKTGSESLFPGSSANWLSLSRNYVLIAGCKKDEFSREYTLTEGNKRIAYGAFTYFLVQALKNAPKNATYQEVFEQLCVNMQIKYSTQHPQIEGQNQRQLFTGTERTPFNYVSVKERDKNKVVLLAGAAHGVTRNSKWGIFASRAKDRSSAKKIGTVKISEVGVVTSKAQIIEEVDKLKVEAGCRAVEEVRYYKNKKTKIFLNISSTKSNKVRQTIAESIRKSPWLALTNREISSEFVVSVGESESKKNGPGEIQIAVVQRRDYKVLWTISKSAKDYHEKICRTLETLAKFLVVAELENPSSKLNGLVEFDLLQKRGEKWGDATAINNNLPLFYEGDEIGFQVTNKSPLPIYLSVLDLGLTKRISLLYPPKAASEKLEKSRSAAGETENPNLGKVKIGVLPNEQITLYIPEGSLVTNLPGIERTGGVEIFKLMVTTEQTNFSWIEQAGLRTKSRSKSTLEALMFRFWSENPTREGNYNVKEETDWLTINRGFYLCKK
jgi:hypothetical protein